jgi:putative acetyltransferase
MIRNEQRNDSSTVHSIYAAAFETTAEADLVDVLRIKAIPNISLVAQENDVLVGHILFTPVSITGHNDLTIMGLAPMAVLPEFKNKGIGSNLVKAGLQKCKELGSDAVVVLGHPNFYSKFGFIPSSDLGISTEYEVPEEVFMVVELQPGALDQKTGTAKYHWAFKSPMERNLGPQPIGKLMQDHKLQASHLVAASPEQITHKMVSKAIKGRRLSPRVKSKVKNALNAATQKDYPIEELFTY